MIRRQTRLQIDEQDVRERALLGRMFSPRRGILHAIVGVLAPVVVVALMRAWS